MNIETVADFACGCGERPTWHPETRTLYFTDVDNPALYAFEATTGHASKVYSGKDIVGGMTLHQDGRLLLFMSRGAIRLWSPEDGEMETLLEGLEGEEESRFNDVIADPKGRVFGGTMPVDDRPGRLYRWDPDGSIRVILEEAGLPNGMGFSPDLSTFYFTDTQARTIDAFRYDQDSGKLSERRTLVKLKDEPGNPDGLAVDAQGNLWSAHYGGHRLVRYSPQGEELSRIDLPMVENPTCPLIVENGTLYLTSAGGGYRPEAGESAGALLRFKVEAEPARTFRSGCANS